MANVPGSRSYDNKRIEERVREWKGVAWKEKWRT